MRQRTFIESVFAMSPNQRDRKPDVIAAMDLIRPLFPSHGYDVVTYSDNEIADAMLDICPKLTQFWLSAEHLRSSLQRLKKGP